jgi:hypothetical protein
MAPLNGRVGAATHVIPSPAPSRILFSALPIRPHICATAAASLAGKSRFKIRQAHVIRPLVTADRNPMRAMVVGAVIQQPAHA